MTYLHITNILEYLLTSVFKLLQVSSFVSKPYELYPSDEINLHKKNKPHPKNWKGCKL